MSGGTGTDGTLHRGAGRIDASHFRRLLVQEKEKYEKIAQGTAGSVFRESMTGWTGDLSSYDQHPADSGNEMFEREQDLGTRARALEVLERIDAALSRIDAGEYGACLSCGRPIPLERLEAIPFAEECVACSQESEEERHRPVEEEVVSFADGFDGRDAGAAREAGETWRDLAAYGTANSPQDAPEDFELPDEPPEIPGFAAGSGWEDFDFAGGLDQAGNFELAGDARHGGVQGQGGPDRPEGAES